MFKRVLLCYDGSEVGRRALKRGAELAILVGAQVYVLSIIPNGIADAAVIAGATGQVCLVDESEGYHKLLDDSVEWLKTRGVAAEGYLASGNIIEAHSDHKTRMSDLDLVNRCIAAVKSSRLTSAATASGNQQGQVKITFLSYPFPLIEPLVSMGGLRMLSVKEIGSTKA